MRIATVVLALVSLGACFLEPSDGMHGTIAGRVDPPPGVLLNSFQIYIRNESMECSGVRAIVSPKTKVYKVIAGRYFRVSSDSMKVGQVVTARLNMNAAESSSPPGVGAESITIRN